jgi:glycerol-3-phosphate responsive antiterminator
MAYTGLTVEYAVNETGQRFFIPSNADVSASVTELNQCKALSPDGVEVVPGSEAAEMSN